MNGLGTGRSCHLEFSQPGYPSSRRQLMNTTTCPLVYVRPPVGLLGRWGLTVLSEQEPDIP